MVDAKRDHDFFAFTIRARNSIEEVSESFTNRRVRISAEAKAAWAQAAAECSRTVITDWTQTGYIGWTAVALHPVAPAQSYAWIFNEVPAKQSILDANPKIFHFIIVFMTPGGTAIEPLDQVAAIFGYAPPEHDGPPTSNPFPIKFLTTVEEINRDIIKLYQTCNTAIFPWPVLRSTSLPPDIGSLPRVIDSRNDWFNDCFFIENTPTIELISLLLSMTIYFLEITPRFAPLFTLFCTRMASRNAGVFLLTPLHKIVPTGIAALSGFPASEFFSHANTHPGHTWDLPECAWIRYSSAEGDEYTINNKIHDLPPALRNPYINFLVNTYVETAFPRIPSPELKKRIAAAYRGLKHVVDCFEASRKRSQITISINQCPICFEEPWDIPDGIFAVLENCGHVICSPCYMRLTEPGRHLAPVCPKCKAPAPSARPLRLNVQDAPPSKKKRILPASFPQIPK